MPDQAVVDAITGMAKRHGIDSATAMAIAERESSFNVRSGSGSPYSSAFGLFQLLRGERAKYGGSSLDPEEQAEAWGRYADDLKSEMTSRLGRNPTGSEFYFGHLIGGTRAARVINGTYHPDSPINTVFTPKERAANPFFDKAGTVGGLASSVMKDIDRRTAKFGGSFGGAEPGASYQDAGSPASKNAAPGFSQPAGSDYSAFSEAVEGGGADYSEFSEPAEQPDYAAFSEAVEQPQAPAAAPA